MIGSKNTREEECRTSTPRYLSRLLPPTKTIGLIPPAYPLYLSEKILHHRAAFRPSRTNLQEDTRIGLTAASYECLVFCHFFSSLNAQISGVGNARKENMCKNNADVRHVHGALPRLWARDFNASKYRLRCLSFIHMFSAECAGRGDECANCRGASDLYAYGS